MLNPTNPLTFHLSICGRVQYPKGLLLVLAAEIDKRRSLQPGNQGKRFNMRMVDFRGSPLSVVGLIKCIRLRTSGFAFGMRLDGSITQQSQSFMLEMGWRPIRAMRSTDRWHLSSLTVSHDIRALTWTSVSSTRSTTLLVQFLT